MEQGAEGEVSPTKSPSKARNLKRLNLNFEEQPFSAHAAAVLANNDLAQLEPREVSSD